MSALDCSFCGKSQHKVRKLIAGPTVFICNECIELCNDIIRSEEREREATKAAEALRAIVREELASLHAPASKPKWRFWRGHSA